MDKKIRLTIAFLMIAGHFSANVTGISSSGQLPPVFIPTNKNPLFSLTAVGDKNKGPNLSVGIKPPDLTMLLDGQLHMSLGKLGDIDTATKVDLSAEGFTAKSQTQILGIDALIDISGDKDKKGAVDPKSLQVDVKLSNKGLKELTGLLKKVGDDFLKDLKEGVEREKNKVLAQLAGTKDKVVAAIDKEIQNIDKELKGAEKRLADITNKCKPIKDYFERSACYYREGTGPVKMAINMFKFRKKTLAARKTAITAKTKVIVVEVAGKALKSTNDAIVFFKKPFDDVAKVATNFASSVFEINKFEFKAKLADFAKKLPAVHIEGKIFGKPFVETIPEGTDFSQASKIIKAIFTKKKPEIIEAAKLIEKLSGKKPAFGLFKMIEQMKNMQGDIRKKAEAAHQAAIKAARKAAAKKGARRVAAK